MNTTLDVLIIGAGPIGIACALEAKKKNLSYLIVEKGVLVNSLYNYPTNMTFFSTSEKLEIDDIPFISSNAKPNKKEGLKKPSFFIKRIILFFCIFFLFTTTHKNN